MAHRTFKETDKLSILHSTWHYQVGTYLPIGGYETQEEAEAAAIAFENQILAQVRSFSTPEAVIGVAALIAQTERLINRTPSGNLRNKLCDVNIMLHTIQGSLT